jgi:hypothetical protein
MIVRINMISCEAPPAAFASILFFPSSVNVIEFATYKIPQDF